MLARMQSRSGGSGVALGRYLLGERLGRGGMGEVYLGLQRGIGSFEKPLALKLLLPHLAGDERTVSMFLDEARVAARMNHPNVTQIFDVGLVDGRYFIAMELVHGVSLAQLIVALAAQQTPPSKELVQGVARALFDGLQHAHGQKGPRGEALELVHRDVTPHNVLVSVDGGVKLADFGIARVQGHSAAPADAEQTRLLGKTAYLPPEQIREQPVDQRADLYSAALTLYHFATLRQPFARSSREETLDAVLFGKPASLGSLRPDLPVALTATLTRALAREPAERPATASAIRDALPPVLGDYTAELGALVRASCAPQLEELEGKTNPLVRARLTEGLSSNTPAPSADERLTAALPAVPRGAWLRAAALGAVLLAGAAFVTLREPAGATAPGVAVAAPAVPKRAVGYLTVDAEPWATVSVRGTLLGETPLSSFPIESGTVEVRLENPETGRNVTRVLQVAEGQQVRLKESLR